MTNSHYDILIIGGGPIGASTAYRLSLAQTGKKIALITKDNAEQSDAAYRNAGGCVRWNWPEPLKRAMTEETRDFIEARLAEGVDLDALRNPYFFLDEGLLVPSLNIASAKLVQWLLDRSTEGGIEVKRGSEVIGIDADGEGYIVHTAAGDVTAAKVLVAIGARTPLFVPGMSFETEKRQLFVLDLPVGPERAEMPHTIIRLTKGDAYFFIKKIGGALRVVVGQEDAVADTLPDGPEPEQFAALLKSGLAAAAPFLVEAKVERVLWQIDAKPKTLLVHTSDNRLIGAACGSAVRGCAHIGRELADRLLA